jgi:PAS domain S-box-containing protein
MDELYPKLLHTAVEAADCPIVITDALSNDNVIAYANPAYLKLSGYTLEEIIGKNPRFMHGARHEQTGLDKLRAAIKEKRPCTARVTNSRRDSTAYLCKVTIRPVFDHDGQLAHWVGTQRDVTSESTLELWSTLLAHDLKSPLIGISTILGQMADQKIGPVNELQQQILVSCRETNFRVLSSLTDMLTLYKTENSTTTINATEVLDANEIVNDAINFRREFMDLGSSIDFIPLNTRRPLVLANKKALTHAFTNIIDNSLQYSSNKVALVRVSMDSEEGAVIVEAENMSTVPLPEHLFCSPFENRDLKHGWSTRLGLYLIRQIIEEHGGSVSAVRTDRGIVRFSISLPLTREHVQVSE